MHDYKIRVEQMSPAWRSLVRDFGTPKTSERLGLKPSNWSRSGQYAWLELIESQLLSPSLVLPTYPLTDHLPPTYHLCSNLTSSQSFPITDLARVLQVELAGIILGQSSVHRGIYIGYLASIFNAVNGSTAKKCSASI